MQPLHVRGMQAPLDWLASRAAAADRPWLDPQPLQVSLAPSHNGT